LFSITPSGFENTMRSPWLFLGILLAAAGVGIGAFGAHGLEETPRTVGKADRFETGAKYQMYHALALIAAAIWAQRSNTSIKWIGLCFSLGIVLFSGSLYILATTGVTKWGMVTPFGGGLFLFGWGLWACKALRAE
jgi:uncharacterized membrane protein YgdD (TMEM256/DUF423 family)